MKSDLKILTTNWFLFGLTILLLNDFIFKELFNNSITGKLSDFAGLFIFPLFWTALFPRFKMKIFWLTGMLFIYWKSPFSQVLIDTWNDLGFLSITRIVDITDLIALMIIPVSFYAYNFKDKMIVIKINPIIPLIASAFAFTATSKGPQTCFLNEENVYYVKHLSRDSLINDLKKSNLKVTFAKYHNTKFHDEHSQIYNLNDSIYTLVVMIQDFNSQDSTVKVSLGCWRYQHGTSLVEADKKTIKSHRNYVKEVFEEKVLKVIERNVL